MVDEQLAAVRDWAQDKLDAGAEPPWARDQYLELVAAIDAIAAARRVVTMADLPQPAPRRGTPLRLAVTAGQRENAPRHPAVQPVQLPM